MGDETEDRARLDALGARLNAVHQDEKDKEQAAIDRRESSSSVSLGMRIGIELLAAVLIGGGIGWFLDQKLHTKPIFLLAFLVLGFTAGVMDVLRIIKGLDQAVGLGRAVREKAKEDNDPAIRDPAIRNTPGFRDEDDD